MKPAPFEFVAPETVDAALEALKHYGHEAKVLAGGQSLIPAMNFRVMQPAVLVDLNRIPGLQYIHPTGSGGLRIGGMTRHSAVEHSPTVAERAPLLHEAMPHIAHPQIRNRGTIGGSLAHADPAAELPVITLALDARLKLQRPEGERWVEAGDFFPVLVYDRHSARRDPDRNRNPGIS
jgi:carbon-monoxide dehydrogenase medium subunit